MEREFIEWLRGAVAPLPRPELGLGDDAAILSTRDDMQLVVTTDMLMETVDFELPAASASQIGHKALAVNLSDLAAMAAEPSTAFISLALPRRGGRELAEGIYAGLTPLAREFNVAIAGGDTNTWDAPLAISVTALGWVPAGGSLLRSGARPGDAIVVTGSFGGSLLGRHLRVAPRVREALVLAREFNATAAIDVSDGLSLDLWRICEASGCGAEIELASVPIHEDAVAFSVRAEDPMSPLDHALEDGEDFELILAIGERDAARLLATQPLTVPVTRIGRFTTAPQMWAVSPDQRRVPLIPRGYEHPFET